MPDQMTSEEVVAWCDGANCTPREEMLSRALKAAVETAQKWLHSYSHKSNSNQPGRWGMTEVLDAICREMSE